MRRRIIATHPAPGFQRSGTDRGRKRLDALRLAAAAILVLTALGPVGARGGEPASANRVGQRVVARSGKLTLRDDRGAVAGVGGKDQVYRVERVERDPVAAPRRGEGAGRLGLGR